LNIRKKVIPIIRHISDPERDYLFALSKAIVLPYTQIYQSGVLLMAMSFPVTVLASDLPPNAELVEHGRNGLLFKSGDRRDLQSKLTEVLEDTFDFSAMNARALEDVDKRYSPEMIGAMYADMFRGHA
jgi:glycosyltransferase involved in cell wall biosynthesis